MSEEIENYKKNYGMKIFLGKPFTSQELWHILLQFLKPISSEYIDEGKNLQRKNKFLKRVQTNFARSYQTVVDDINEAIKKGDFTLAHRLVHSLKGNAGQINESALENTAQIIEKILLTEPENITNDILKALESEMRIVLEKLKPLLDEPESVNKKKPMGPDEVKTLFEELLPMLKNSNTKCIRYLDDLRAIPEAKELALQIERIELRAAYKTLISLMEQQNGASGVENSN
jgi:HPt (histidine-containing phosphotransfer) domain-containing protein